MISVTMQLNLYQNHSLYLKARSVALIIDIIGVVFISTATALQPNFSTDGFGGFADGMQLAPLTYSFLWTSATIGLALTGKRYHPGVDVAFDLIAWALAFGAVWLLIYWTAIIGDYYQNCGDDGCTRVMANAIKASELIGIMAVLISGTLHFIYFCQACAAVQRLPVKRSADNGSFHELNEDLEVAKN